MQEPRKTNEDGRRLDRPSPLGGIEYGGKYTIDPKTQLVTVSHDQDGKVIGGKSDSKDK